MIASAEDPLEKFVETSLHEHYPRWLDADLEFRECSRKMNTFFSTFPLGTMPPPWNCRRSSAALQNVAVEDDERDALLDLYLTLKLTRLFQHLPGGVRAPASQHGNYVPPKKKTSGMAFSSDQAGDGPQLATE